MVGNWTSHCRSCGSTRLTEVLDLGSTPVANDLVDPADSVRPDQSYPLNVLFCEECALVQLGFTLPADAIFGAEYPYFTSFSDTLCDHAERHATSLIETQRLDTSSLAVEVASNDGYLLRHFVAAGIPTVGIDPAPGPAAAAERIGVPTIVGFFGVDLAQEIAAEHGRADVIIANNVMAHVPDLNDFVGGFAELIKDDGVITIENPWVRDIVERVEFDTIYHEHYCYFSCTSVDTLATRHGLHLNDVEYFPDIHGGSLRWHLGRRANRSERCELILAKERTDGIASVSYYMQFADRTRRCQEALRSLLHEMASAGRRVAAYGAAAKGATLLNTSGVDSSMISFVVDRNTHKQGKLMPGCRVPILAPSALLDTKVDDVILLAWNFAAEIVRQQDEFLQSGGKFWIPVPLPHELDLGAG
jgi:SAM-dependent methyltransferase